MDQFQPNTRFSIFPPAIKYLLIANAIVFLVTKSIFTGAHPWALSSSEFRIWSIEMVLCLGSYSAICFYMPRHLTCWLLVWLINRASMGYTAIYYLLYAYRNGVAVIHMIVVAISPTIGLCRFRILLASE